MVAEDSAQILRQQVRAWLQANVPVGWRQAMTNSEQAAGYAGVFAGNLVCQGQDLDSPQGQVRQITDGRGDQVERTFGILLPGGDLAGCLEQRFGIKGHNKIPGR